MARPKNPKAVEAEKLYKENKKKLVEIAEILDVPVGSIRRWKHTYNWDENIVMNTERSESKIPNARKRKEAKDSARSVMDNSELTDKEQEFCLAFVQRPVAVTAYQKVFGGGYNLASTKAWRLLQKVRIKREIERLKKIKFESMMIREEDLVEKYMRIAFSDIGDYVEWGREETPIMTAFGPLQEKNPETGEMEEVTAPTNYIHFKGSDEVDSSLVKKVAKGRDGISVEIIDPLRAMEWLDRYFVICPEDKYKVEYERKRAESELKNAEASRAESVVINILPASQAPQEDGEE